MSPGVSIGADFGYDDQTRVGFAYSNAQSSFNYGGRRRGDTVKAKSDVYSLYGYTNLADLTLLGMTSYVDSNIKVRQLKTLMSGVSQLYTANPKARAYVVESNLGYNIKVKENFVLQPNIGLRYGKYITDEFTPKATNGGLFSETTRKNSKGIVTGIVGAKAQASYQLSENTNLAPGLSANIEYDFNNKNTRLQTRFAEYLSSSEALAASAVKPRKAAYNLGTSLSLRHKNMELSTHYNCKLRKQYQAHQGSLKLVLNF